MASLIHIAEVAALLAVAYVVGWVIGYVLRRLTARPGMPARVVAAATTPAASPGDLVKAPEIVPVANDPPPPIPAPAVPQAPKVEPTPETPIVTERLAGSTPATGTTLAPIVIAPVAPPPPMFVKREEANIPAEAPAEPPPPPVAPTPEMTEPAPAAIEVPPEPVAPPPPAAPVQVPVAPVAPLPAVEPVAVITATPALNPGEAWTGEIKGRPARKFDIPAEATVASNTGDVPEQPDAAEPVMTAQASPAPAAPPPPVYDEDAAMRAIEGGWSRTRARAMPGAPELADVGAAVAAAQSAVEQVLAQAGIDPEAGKHAGKPTGLPRPRPAGKDNLKQISGLSPLDESTLNNLGVYHFDQIAGWSETEVLWMENHVFARGRVGREDWQGQARALANTVAG